MVLSHDIIVQARQEYIKKRDVNKNKRNKVHQSQVIELTPVEFSSTVTAINQREEVNERSLNSLSTSPNHSNLLPLTSINSER
jgi:hypothetical protein